MADPFPHWVRDPQLYAVEQERSRHNQALFSYGEYAIFVLMWRVQDHNAGLVQRCHRCYLAQGKVAEAYGQGKQNKCPDCFGTTFEGGYKAILVRQSIWSFTEETDTTHRRGKMRMASATVQSTNDFLIRSGDYAFKGDGSRYQTKTPGTVYLSTGFQVGSLERQVVGANIANIVKEDPDSVAHLIPPTREDVVAALDVSGFRYPLDFSAIEDIRGPLL